MYVYRGSSVNIRTDGFWDYDLFKDNKNIFFSDNSLETWTENIKNLYGNTDLLNKISEASFDTVNESLSLEKFNKNCIIILIYNSKNIYFELLVIDLMVSIT